MLNPNRKTRRAGAAAVEMAVLVPLLVFLCVIAVDFARVFYFSLTVANCARNGAMWASDVYVRAESPYKTLKDAALADAQNLVEDTNNPTTVTSASGIDADGMPYVEVTVSYHFKTITGFPGVPNNLWLTRTVRMATAPPNPS